MLPRKVTVLGETWKVKRLKEVIDSNGQELLGLCSYNEKTISVKITDPKLEMQTFFHELAHAAIMRCGLIQAPQWNLNLEEIAVENIATVFAENNISYRPKK